ncbi:MAG: CPBP family intramembrane metalloprotease [Deinococcales bacterium]
MDTATLAALVALGAEGGMRAAPRLVRGFARLDVPARWYAAAVIPLGAALAAAGIYRLVGGASAGGPGLSPASWAGLALVALVSGPLGEEAGWRGLVLPRLLDAHTPLGAGVRLGLLWDGWHVPLWFVSGGLATHRPEPGRRGACPSNAIERDAFPRGDALVDLRS